jgi:hypothetical protein
MSVRSISSVEPWTEPWKNLTDGPVRTMVLDRTTAALVVLGKSSGMNVSRYRVQDMEVKMERVRLNILMREGQSP